MKTRPLHYHQLNDFHVFPFLCNYILLGPKQVVVYTHEHYWGMRGEQKGYRAGASVDCGLAEGLSHGEGDMGGADAGGRLDGQALPLLRDLHRRAGRGRHGNLTQEHIHT